MPRRVTAGKAPAPGVQETFIVTHARVCTYTNTCAEFLKIGYSAPSSQLAR